MRRSALPQPCSCLYRGVLRAFSATLWLIPNSSTPNSQPLEAAGIASCCMPVLQQGGGESPPVVLPAGLAQRYRGVIFTSNRAVEAVKAAAAAAAEPVDWTALCAFAVGPATASGVAEAFPDVAPRVSAMGSELFF